MGVFGKPRDRIVIAGAGACGASAAQTLRAEGYDGPITLIGHEREPPYERPLLTREFLLRRGGESAQRVKPAQWFLDNDIELVLGTDVLGVSPKRQRVRLSTGRSMRYSRLLIATGGRPRRLPQITSERVRYLRTRKEAQELSEWLRPGEKVVVLGAGFVGSEVAAAARGRGAEVTMLDARDIPLQRSVGRDIARSLGDLHKAAGVEVRTGERALAAREIPGGLLVETNRGRLECGVLLVALGMQPNTECFSGSGIEINKGVVVDEFCRTSVPGVFAAGDVAEQFHPLYGRRLHVEHFDNAIRQGRHAAVNMLGRNEAAREPGWFWSDQYEHNLQSVGDLAYADDVVVRGRLDEASFSVFYLKRGTIQAALSLNRPKDVTIGRRLVAARARVAGAELRDLSSDLRAISRTAVRG
jgi:3-phenylpropionate/trans-cinnamate dioxygenase ferredoxin reductase subunit